MRYQNINFICNYDFIKSYLFFIRFTITTFIFYNYWKDWFKKINDEITA